MNNVRKSEVAFFVGGAVYTTIAFVPLYGMAVIRSGLSHSLFVLGLILITWAWFSFLYWDTNEF